MPAMTNPQPESEQSRSAAQAPPQRPSVMPKLLFFLGLIAVGAGILYYLNSSRQEQAQQATVASFRTATVQRGPLETRLRVTGQTSARSFANIVVPRLRSPEGGGGMVVLKLAPSGSWIKKGEIVAEFDSQSMKDHLDDTIAGLRDKENDLKKRKVEQELDMENLQQSLRQAKAALDKAKLDERTTEIRTDIDREMLKLAVEEADAAYKELLTDVPQKLASQKADMRMLEIGKKMEDMHVERHEEDLKRVVMLAPMDGMVVLQTINRPGGEQVSIAVGDRVGPGQPVAKVIDPATMQVEGAINQSESSVFRIGQEAAIGLDAFPGRQYKGKVYSIGALAVAGGRSQYYIRSVPVRVQITNVDNKLIPDLSASADVLLMKEPDVLVAPASAVERDGDKDVIYVKTAGGFEKRVVKLGINNGTQVAVLEGLKDGEVIRVN